MKINITIDTEEERAKNKMVNKLIIPKLLKKKKKKFIDKQKSEFEAPSSTDAVKFIK